MNQNDFSHENGFQCEFDHYTMPAYDPTIPPDERERRIKDADRRMKEAIERILERNSA